MLNAFFIAAALFVAQKQQETAVITGAVVTASEQEISQPLQVILLSPRYLDLWNSEVQKRLDRYWQQFQPAFRNEKEYFSELSKQAHRDATTYVVNRMRRDPGGNISSYLMETTPGGKFEFRNIPFGEYKILAIGKVGNQDVMWQEFVDVRSSIPHFIELKKRVP
jgi:hypothetical protein